MEIVEVPVPYCDECGKRVGIKIVVVLLMLFNPDGTPQLSTPVYYCNDCCTPIAEIAARTMGLDESIIQSKV